MRILLYGDLHVNFSQSLYMTYVKKTLQFLFDTIVETKPDILINLGDLTDTFGTVSVRDLVWAAREMHILSSLMHQVSSVSHFIKPHWILKGNHDIDDADGKYSTTELMEDVSTETFTEPVLSLYDTGITIIPYTKDYERVHSILEMTSSVRNTCVVGHIDWVGVNLTPTFISQGGFSPIEYKKIMGDVPCFNGHYHNPTALHDPVHFVGAPLMRDFSDTHDLDIPRGFLLYDTDGSWTRIENPESYKLATVRLDSSTGLDPLLDFEDPTKTKVRVFCPRVLVEEARKLCKEFLWHSVQPVDSNKSSMDYDVQVSLTTPRHQVIKAAVEAADLTYKKPMLQDYGEEAFDTK